MHRDFDGVPQAKHLAALPLELGDVLWYVTAIAQDYGWTLADILEMNKEKLTARDIARGRSAA